MSFLFRTSRARTNVMVWVGALVIVGAGVAAFITPASSANSEATTSSALGAIAAPWTTVGSTGIVDDSDVSNVARGVFAIDIAGGAPNSTTIDIRYNVVAVDDMANFPGPGGGLGDPFLQITVRFKDNGSNAQVLVRLKEISLSNGTTTTLSTLDSNDFSSSANFQTQVEDDYEGGLDFDNNAYVLDVDLIRSGSGGEAGIECIQLLVIDPA
jgi:hypothetical protein